VHAIGLQGCAGPGISPNPWYWDRERRHPRLLAERFAKAEQAARSRPWCRPASIPAVLHYLKAVHERKSEADWCQGRREDEGDCRPTIRCSARASIRADGRKVHDDVPLRGQEAGRESKGPWDYYKQRATVLAAEQAFQPLAETGCSLVK
jgi:branched-chain amino acid transport system substrate-binding protein